MIDEQQILDLEGKPLSNEDLFRMTDGKVNVYTYDELNNFETLDQALDPYGSMIVLYESKPHVGHWVTINKVGPDLIEFFDPYSVRPDKEFKWVSQNYKKYPRLSQLMKESPYKLSYNEHKLQKWKKGVNTCGRFAVLRVILKNKSLKEFNDLMNSTKYDPDFLATYLTENLIT